MTTPTSNPQGLIDVRYEGVAPSFGGFDSADFAINRPGHHILEVNLRLSADGRALFEEALRSAGKPALDDRDVAAVMQALGLRQYRALAGQDEILAIITVRARDLSSSTVNEILSEAGLL